MATTAVSHTLRFDNYELDTRAGQLRKGGVKLRLRGQPLQVLAILVEHAGEVVTREELQRQIWTADTFVDFDHGLHNAIARIREALGDSAETPRYIETLPRRGYRFITQVHEVDSGASTPPFASSRDRRGIRAVSALPQHSTIVGREREIEEVCNLMRTPVRRLVTLTGVGGTGKT